MRISFKLTFAFNSYGDKLLINRLTTIWNALPTQLKVEQRFAVFKKQIKKKLNILL